VTGTKKIAITEAASIPAITVEHDFVGATGGRRRAWRHWLRFGGSRSCGHLFALGAVRLRVAEAGVISNALRLAEESRCGLRVL
jgi:hypothetical protein